MNNTPDNKTIFVGDDNVFAELGLPNADERQAKAAIAISIERIIDENLLTHAEAAQRMGLTQPEVSRIVQGRLKSFTLEQVHSLLAKIRQ